MILSGSGSTSVIKTENHRWDMAHWLKGWSGLWEVPKFRRKRELNSSEFDVSAHA